MQTGPRKYFNKLWLSVGYKSLDVHFNVAHLSPTECSHRLQGKEWVEIEYPNPYLSEIDVSGLIYPAELLHIWPVLVGYYTV